MPALSHRSHARRSRGSWTAYERARHVLEAKQLLWDPEARSSVSQALCCVYSDESLCGDVTLKRPTAAFITFSGVLSGHARCRANSMADACPNDRRERQCAA